MNRVAFLAVVAALSGFLFGYDTAVINGGELAAAVDIRVLRRMPRCASPLGCVHLPRDERLRTQVVAQLLLGRSPFPASGRLEYGRFHATLTHEFLLQLRGNMVKCPHGQEFCKLGILGGRVPS